MTRKSPPRARVLARYGDDGPWTVHLGAHSPFVAEPSADAAPSTLADRYTATAEGEPHDIHMFTLIDRVTGATVAIHRDQATLTVPATSEPEYVGRLWHDARNVLGEERRRGRPPGTGSIQSDDEILRVILEMQHAKIMPGKITVPTIVATSGTFTEHELRGYLARTGKRISGGKLVPK